MWNKSPLNSRDANQTADFAIFKHIFWRNAGIYFLQQNTQNTVTRTSSYVFVSVSQGL